MSSAIAGVLLTFAFGFGVDAEFSGSIPLLGFAEKKWSRVFGVISTALGKWSMMSDRGGVSRAWWSAMMGLGERVISLDIKYIHNVM